MRSTISNLNSFPTFTKMVYMGKFIIARRINGEYYFKLQSDNGIIILRSEGYASRMSCLNGIESVRVDAAKDDRYDKQESYKGEHYFNLKAPNGQVIASSEMYTTRADRDHAIESAKQNAPDAVIQDQSS